MYHILITPASRAAVRFHEAATLRGQYRGVPDQPGYLGGSTTGLEMDGCGTRDASGRFKITSRRECHSFCLRSSRAVVLRLSRSYCRSGCLCIARQLGGTYPNGPDRRPTSACSGVMQRQTLASRD